MDRCCLSNFSQGRPQFDLVDGTGLGLLHCVEMLVKY